MFFILTTQIANIIELLSNVESDFYNPYKKEGFFDLSNVIHDKSFAFTVY